MAKKGKTRRKSRSAAQKRASKKNIKKAQASRRRNKPKTRRKSKKSNKPKKNTKKRMAKGGKKKIIDKIPVLKNKTVQRIGFGLGMGVIAVGIIDLAARFGPPALVAPLVQNKQIIKLGTELVTEPLSAVADVVLSGGIGGLNLSSLSGSRNGQINGVQTVGNGFA